MSSAFGRLDGLQDVDGPSSKDGLDECHRRIPHRAINLTPESEDVHNFLRCDVASLTHDENSGLIVSMKGELTATLNPESTNCARCR